MSRNKDLIVCYLSGQIADVDWQRLLKEEPGLKEEWESDRMKYILNEDFKLDWEKLGVWLLIGVFCVACWWYGYRFGGWVINSLFGG
tara:strand:- start:4269 stop:4529 length:261 start_codon:yes stop_codon:yes gene_type:complete